MSILHPGRGLRGGGLSSGRCWAVSPAGQPKRADLFLLVCLLAVFPACLYSQGNYQGGEQTTPPAECSDPLFAGSPQCAGQNTQTPGTSPYSISPQTTSPTSPFPIQPSGLSPTYSDIESQQRQTANRYQLGVQPYLPPEPLTEFQKFVASTTNQILPIFGANLFRNVPSTFAPLDMTPVPQDYVIGPGDELRIRVWGQVNFQSNVRVDRSGEIYIPVPQVGPVHVADVPYSDLTNRLREAIGRVYRNFDVLADVGQIRAIQIYVAGEARRPGVYTVSSLSTLIDALFASGGPSVQGSLRHIELRRCGTSIADFDLYAFLVHGDKSKDVKLASGDVIFIPPVGPQVAVTGSVRVPAIYELLADESLSGAIADAGGVSSIASESRVSIERIENHNARQALEVAYDPKGLATPAADGDLIRVFSILPKYDATVTLRGNIANPGRFAWHQGMHLSELIPDKDSLVTRDYWWKRARLGLPGPEFEPVPGFSTLRQPPENHPLTMRPRAQPSGIAPSGAPETGQDQFGNQQDLYQYQQGLYPPDLYPPQQTPYGSQQNVYGSQRSPYGSQQNSAGSQQETALTAQQRASSATLASEQATRTFAGVQPTRIERTSPDIDWNYAVIQRFDQSNLKTNLVPFDLGKLVLAHDSSQDLELQPGDVVSILSEADIRIPIAQQTKIVRLDGEFVHAGTYTALPGETLRQLVVRAGGLTPNAYLYGSEFTRESTRAVQQARIDEYVQTLDMRLQRSTIALASSPVNSALAGGAAQSSERELLARLRLIRATGRIVLEFRPSASGVNAVPDVALEDGDRFAIPSVPASVNVVGAVNDQNSFLYARERRVENYLQKAGGLTKDADRRREFVIRADGEVVGYGGKGLWGNQFDSLRVYPGDTIVVPEKTYKPSAVRGVLDWSNMFSQFALGAASISVIAP